MFDREAVGLQIINWVIYLGDFRAKKWGEGFDPQDFLQRLNIFVFNVLFEL